MPTAAACRLVTHLRSRQARPVLVTGSPGGQVTGLGTGTSGGRHRQIAQTLSAAGGDRPQVLCRSNADSRPAHHSMVIIGRHGLRKGRSPMEHTPAPGRTGASPHPGPAARPGNGRGPRRGSIPHEECQQAPLARGGTMATVEADRRELRDRDRRRRPGPRGLLGVMVRSVPDVRPGLRAGVGAAPGRGVRQGRHRGPAGARRVVRDHVDPDPDDHPRQGRSCTPSPARSPSLRWKT